MTPDMLTITDAAYASFLLDQNTFQASEATLKVSNLCPLNTIITGFTDTLGTALANLPDPTACNYLLCSIEPPLFPENNFISLCFHRQFASYTSNLITSLYPTLALLYPEIQKTEVWITPNQHNCTNTISEIQASSNSHLQAIMIFKAYSNTQSNQTPRTDSDLPPRFLHTKQHPKGKPSPPHRPQAPTSPQPYHNSWTKSPHIQPNNQPTISSIAVESTPIISAESKLLLNLQAEVAALTLRLGPNNPSPNEAILSAVTDLLNQSLSLNYQH